MGPQAPSLSPAPSSSSPPPSEPVDHASSDDRPSSSASNHELPPHPSSSSLLSDAVLPTPKPERHPKGKRKRTAAKDKAILEAAYIANPKPDKAARLAIVNRVSLNEKEVQIWFQNRRQNDRRKSRPLSPQEIAALRYGSMQILSSDPPAFNSSFSSDNADPLPSSTMSRPEPGVASPPHSDAPSFHSGDEPEQTPAVPREARKWDDAEGPEQSVAVTPAQNPQAARETVPESSQSQSSFVGYLSNRWNSGSSFPTPSTLGRREGDSVELEPFVPSSSSPTSSRPLPHPEPSRYRLALSLDGKAEVVSSNPSPPRPLAPSPKSDDLQALGPVRRLGLYRSHSASSPITLPPISVLTNSLPIPGGRPRLARGWSRDAHVWELCCDSESREDFLTVQAKAESSGSAIAAISLIRSASGTGSPLQPSNSAKRNAVLSRAAPQAKKPRLARAMSSTARLQSGTVPVGKISMEKERREAPEKLKMPSPSGNDSDKENWSPDEDGNPRFTFSQPQPGATTIGRRPLPSSPVRLDKRNPRRTPGRPSQSNRSPKAILGGRSNTNPMFSQARRGVKRDQSPLEIYEDSETTSPAGHVPAAAEDDEVERFMRGEVSPSKKSDVDAVAGLLSLSQGNWR